MGASITSLTVLLTNLCLDWPSGTVVYTRDLALELQWLGHRPIVYTWLNGQVGLELAAAGVQVVTDLWRVHVRPDVFHGHHGPLVRGALLRFPDVPAVVFCHNSKDPWDAPAPDPGIRRYFGVSELCATRLLSLGARDEATSVRPNFVDVRKYTPKRTHPPRPARALIFDNYTTADTNLPTTKEAMARAGIALDAVGHNLGRVSAHPENLLSDYDLVFAVGKAALEAMAVGAAVVLCSGPGLGPMVTTASFDGLRAKNFGMAALADQVTLDGIERAIGGYDPAARPRYGISSENSAASRRRRRNWWRSTRTLSPKRRLQALPLRAELQPAPATVASPQSVIARPRCQWSPSTGPSGLGRAGFPDR
ncbi:MAG TPA: hypothetical protein VF337_08940 [Candidatus Limnocylindrales bacterium]